MARTGTDRGDGDEQRGRGAAGTAGAAAAAGAAVTGAQALLGMDGAEAIAEDGADSVVPLGDAPGPADEVDLQGDVETFLADDAPEASPDGEVLADELGDVGDDPLAALVAAEDGADAGALDDHDDLDDGLDDDLPDEAFEEPSLDL